MAKSFWLKCPSLISEERAAWYPSLHPTLYQRWGGPTGSGSCTALQCVVLS